MRLRPLTPLGLLLGCSLACGCSLAPGDGAVTITEMHRHDGGGANADRPPPVGEMDHAPLVALPDPWSAERRSKHRQAWYAAELDLAATPSERWAVYLPLLSMNAAVWVNGEPIGDGGPMEPHLAWMWARPLLLPVPFGLLHQGRNRIEVRLVVRPTFLAVLAPPVIGPDASVRPAFEARTFWQTTLVQVSIALAAYLGLVGLALGMRPGAIRSALWTSAGCLLWALAMLQIVVREPPLPALLWQWIAPTALVGSVSCFAIGVQRFIDTPSVRFVGAVLGVWLAGAAAFAGALAGGDPVVCDRVVLGWAVATTVIAASLVRRLFLLRSRISSTPLRSAAPLAMAAFAAGMHDLGLSVGLALPPPFLLLPYMGALVALWGGWRLIDQLSSTLAESDALNRDLERRVAARGEEIARGYERIRVLERDQAVQSERERLMRDIHDGLGGQLTSTLALVESDEVERDEIADALRDSLDDMRLLVSSLAPADDDLLALVAAWRARIEPRLERHGLRFDWRVTDLPPLAWLGPRESLSVLRIFQEAVTNVIKHARATTITVRTASAPGPGGAAGVLVEIRDDGIGFEPAVESAGATSGSAGATSGSAAVGHGLANMRRRAAAIGGRLDVTSSNAGLVVALWLPIERDGAAG